MSNQLHAASRVPYFQGIEKIDKTKQYSTFVTKANNHFKDNYKDEYIDLITNLQKSATEWTATQKTVTTEELRERLIQATKYQKERIEAKTALEKIKNAFLEALTKIFPPKLDPNTLQELQKMGGKMADVEKKYCETFIEYPTKMRDQIRIIDARIEEIDDAYYKMKGSLEPVFRQREGTYLDSMIWSIGGRTPSLDRARKALLESMPASNIADTISPTSEANKE